MTRRKRAGRGRRRRRPAVTLGIATAAAVLAVGAVVWWVERVGASESRLEQVTVQTPAHATPGRLATAAPAQQAATAPAASKSTSAEPADSPEATPKGGAQGLAWAGFVLALLALGTGSAALLRTFGLLGGRLAAPPQTRAQALPTGISGPTTREAPIGSLERRLRELENRRVPDLEEQLEELRRAFVRPDAGGQPAPEPPPNEPAWPELERGFDSGFAALTAADGAPVEEAEVMGAPGVQLFPGVLGNDDQVRVRESSRPMVEIRWSPGAANAEVYVNRDFKFGDLTVPYLASAFQVEGGGPGSYETLDPALVQWAAGATAGRVTKPGRVRALGG